MTLILDWLKVSIRQFVRNKTVSAINVVGLAVGLASCILIMLWVQGELDHDRRYGMDNLYRVILSYTRGGTIVKTTTTPGLLGPSLEREFPEIVNCIRVAVMGPADELHCGDTIFANRSVAMADPDFVKMLSIRFLEGNMDAIVENVHAIVITREIAETYFAGENPIGRTISTASRSYTIEGVIENIEPTSHIKFSFLLPPSAMTNTFGSLDTWRGQPWLATYVQLSDATQYASLSKKILSYLAAKPDQPDAVEVHLQPMDDIYFNREIKGGTSVHGEKQNVYILSFAALLILLIAGMNFVNLSSAKALYRAREVGLRKVVGAKRIGLIFRFLGESVLTCALTMVLAILLVELVLPVIANTWGIRLSLRRVEPTYLFAGLSAAVVLIGVLSGIYPALMLSSFQPAKVLKGLSGVGGGRGLIRKALVVCQFTLSTVFIIGFVTISLQVKHMHDKGLGFDRDNVLYWGNKSILRPKGSIFKRELLRYNGVEYVTWCSGVPGVGTAISYRVWHAEEGLNAGSGLMSELHGDADVIDVFGLEIVEGVAFSNRSLVLGEGKYVILNESAVKALGLQSPLGRKIGPQGLRDLYTVVGIVKDFHYRPLNFAIEPLVIVYNSDFSNLAFIRVRPGNLTATLDHIQSTIKRVYPGTIPEVRFLDKECEQIYRSEQDMGVLIGLFTGLALFISCLGLAGLSLFVVEKRTREIGIRKILGSSVPRTAMLLSKEFLGLILITNLIAWPVAYFVASRWLENFAYRIQISWKIFVLTGTLTLILAAVTVTAQTVRAALANPADVLRHE